MTKWPVAITINWFNVFINYISNRKIKIWLKFYRENTYKTITRLMLCLQDKKKITLCMLLETTFFTWNCFFLKAFNRLAGFSINAFNEETFNPGSPDPHSLVYHHDPMSGCPAPILNITVNRLARQIVFTNHRPEGYQSTCPINQNYTNVEICEIKVMGRSTVFITKN